MSKIDYSFYPIPKSMVNPLCLNKNVPVRIRVYLVIIGMVVGYDQNRRDKKADIGFRLFVTKTGASKRQIIRAIKGLEAEGMIETDHKRGRGHRNTYTLKVPPQPIPEGMEEYEWYSEDSKKHITLRPIEKVT